MALHHAAPLLQVRAEPSGLVRGYASVFGVRDSHGDIINRGAFAGIGESTIPMLWAHDQGKPVGHWKTLREDEAGLYAEGQINLRTQAGRDAFEHVSNSDISGLSIGFILPSDGYKYEGETRFLTRVDVKEVSLVAIPSNPAARVLEARNLTDRPDSLRALEHLLKQAGFSRREAQAIAAKGWGAHITEAEEEAAALERLKALSKLFA